MRYGLTIIALAIAAVAAIAIPKLMVPEDAGPARRPARAVVVTPGRPFQPPIHSVGQLMVRDLVDARDFVGLDRLFQWLHDRYIGDVTTEGDLTIALLTFDTTDPAVQPALDAWIAAAPRSAYARLARARYWTAIALDRRGKRVADETTQEQFSGMNAYLDRAVADARAALERNARAALAYRVLMTAARNREGIQECGAQNRAGLAIVPESYELRAQAMSCLLPRWGGSHEMMDEYAFRAQVHRPKYPRLEALGGFSSWDRGDRLLARGEIDDAIREFNRALQFGDDWRFYEGRGRALWKADRLEEALADYERAAAMAPLLSEPVIGRALLRAILGRSDERAAQDVAAIERLHPGDDRLAHYKAWPARKAVAAAVGLYEAGRLDEAIAAFTKVHADAPGQTDALSRRGTTYLKKKDLDRALADFEADIELDPRRFISYHSIDWILAHKAAWDRIIDHWNRYIALEPNDPRGYIERGGAYSQKGDRQKARFDARKACDLGSEKGCEIARKVGA